jgi:hypothetical protein
LTVKQFKKESKMSAMSNLALDVDLLLDEGRSALEIAAELDIPVTWVIGVQEEKLESTSPFATINS